MYVIAENIFAAKVSIYSDEIFQDINEATEFMKTQKLAKENYTVMTLDTFIEEQGNLKYISGYETKDIQEINF